MGRMPTTDQRIVTIVAIVSSGLVHQTPQFQSERLRKNRQPRQVSQRQTIQTQSKQRMSCRRLFQ
jgi:hypothetical protein